MNGMTPKLTVLAAALASSLVFTFSAFAPTRPDDRAGVHGSGTVTAGRAVSGDPALAARLDNRAGVLGVGTTATASPPVRARASAGQPPASARARPPAF